MRAITVTEARKTWGALLDLVERGQEVIITRRGKRVARLVRDTRGREISVDG
jgi:prevent-host-death family protein